MAPQDAARLMQGVATIAQTTDTASTKVLSGAGDAGRIPGDGAVAVVSVAGRRARVRADRGHLVRRNRGAAGMARRFRYSVSLELPGTDGPVIGRVGTLP
jgi:hypothetical protein